MKKDILKNFVDQHRSEFETPNLDTNIWQNIEQKLDQLDQDSLKNFVDQERAEFESDFDSQEVWQKIDQSLPKQQTIFYRIAKMAWKVAAMLILVSGIAWFSLKMMQSEESLADQRLQKIAPELVEAEKYYSALIKQKMQIIQAKGNEDKQIFADLQMLDSAYSVLRLDLEDGVANEEVINAMIQNHRIKLEILENILEEIQDGENENQPEQL
ncbi:MAG: hypothetical protein EAZ97_09225 [Bacteroidetes bacterium]|nr:MAG: hypothetical protein EAZ97_09225 [Bacteroidota bacterium]